MQVHADEALSLNDTFVRNPASPAGSARREATLSWLLALLDRWRAARRAARLRRIQHIIARGISAIE
jgi:hypothetical protein